MSTLDMDMMNRKRIGEEIDGNDNFKRMKMSGPSKVLHFRSLPPATTESDLAAVCAPYGTVVKVLVLQAKSQGFVQLDSIESAQFAVTRLAAAPPKIKGKQVFVQFSNRDEINAPGAGNAGAGGAGVGEGGQQQPNHILLVSVKNTKVLVTIEHLHQIFKPFGDVLKIVTFNKAGTFKALVQMSNVESAINARAFLDGKDMFMGCCHLSIGFSNLTDLKVVENNSKSRDFTIPENPFNLINKVPNLLNALVGGNQFTAPQFGNQFGGNMGSMGGNVGGSSAPAPPLEYKSEVGCVVLASNLDPERFTPDMLFMLFGCYGDVVRVKILYNKRDNALIQFANAQQASLALMNLNRTHVFGKELRISISKFPEIALPRNEDQLSMNLTKDFTDSPVHRFRHRGVRATKNIFPPSQVLHASNIYDSASEDDLRKLFAEFSSQSPVIQFFKKDRKMAYVKLGSVDEAVVALMKLHNTKVGGQFLRLSFTGKNEEALKNTDSSAAGGMDFQQQPGQLVQQQLAMQQQQLAEIQQHQLAEQQLAEIQQQQQIAMQMQMGQPFGV